ncbi:MAG TPA: protein kinase [Gemmatimonadaceae bacterium]|nr:protein kinase [Gemmatimonadaceae bacterium]
MARSLTVRTVVGASTLACGIVLAALAATYSAARRSARDDVRRGLDQSADLVAQFLAGRERTLIGGARVFVQSSYFRTLVAEQRRDDLLDQAFEAAEQLGANWVFITDERGTLVAKSDEPNASGVAMGNVPLVATALRGGTATGFGVSGDTALFQVVALPIVARAGAPVGVLVAVRVVDSTFIDDLRTATGSDVLLYVRDATDARRVIASTVGSTRDVAAALALGGGALHAGPSRSPRGDTRSDSMPGDGALSVIAKPSSLRIGTRQFDAHGATLATAGGEPVGGFFVLRESVSEAAVLHVVLPLLIAAILAAAAAVVLATRWTRRGVTDPLCALIATIDAAADGGARPAVGATASVSGAPDAGGVAEVHELRRAVQRLLIVMQDAASLTPLAHVPHEERALSTRDALPRDTAVLAAGARPMTAPRREFALITSREPAARSRTLVTAATPLLADRYQLEADLGHGGHGTVYRAFDRVLGESVAIKRLRGDWVGERAGSLDALAHETRLTRRLTHRNIVRVFDLVTTDGAPFLTMEFVNGASLGDVVAARGRLDPTAVLAIARQLLRALAYAHEHGIVHGDVKPRNLLIDATGVLKLADFGVARSAREHAPAGGNPVRPLLTGAIVGTPEYMAPEQLLGGPATPRSDLYAAGTVLHECLEGLTPFAADTPMTFVARKLAEEMRPARQLTLSRAGDIEVLRVLVNALTAVEPAGRPASAGAALEQLS